MSWFGPTTGSRDAYTIQIQEEASEPLIITDSRKDAGRANASSSSSASQQRGLLASKRVLLCMRGKAVMRGESLSAAASFNDAVLSDLLKRDRLSENSADDKTAATSCSKASNVPVDVPRGLAATDDPATKQRWEDFSKRSATACRARLQMSDSTILEQAQAKYQQLSEKVGSQLASQITAAAVREQARLRNSDPLEIAFPLFESSSSWQQENEAGNSEEQQAPLGMFQDILEPLTGRKLLPIRAPFGPYDSLEERLQAISTESAVKAWAAKLLQRLSTIPVSDKEDAALIEQLVATKAAERRALAKVDKRTSVQQVPFPTLQQLVDLKRFETVRPTLLRQLSDDVEPPWKIDIGPSTTKIDIGPSTTKPKISKSGSKLGWLSSKKGDRPANEMNAEPAAKSAPRPVIVSITSGFSSWGSDTEANAAARARLGPYFESVYAGDWWQSEAGKREPRSVDVHRMAAQVFVENWRRGRSSPGVYESIAGDMPCVWQHPDCQRLIGQKTQRHYMDSTDMWACLSGRTGPDTRSAFQVAKVDSAVTVKCAKRVATASQALSAKGQPTEGAAQKHRAVSSKQESKPLAWAELPSAVVNGEELPQQQKVRIQRQAIAAITGKRALPWRLDLQRSVRKQKEWRVDLQNNEYFELTEDREKRKPSDKELLEYRLFCKQNRGFAKEVEADDAEGLLRCARHKPLVIKVAEGKWPHTKLVNGIVPLGTHILEVERHAVFDSQFIVLSWQQDGLERTGILSLQEWAKVPGWGPGVHINFCTEVLAVAPRPRNHQRLAIHKYIHDMLGSAKNVAGRSLITSAFSNTQGSVTNGLIHTPSMEFSSLGTNELQTDTASQRPGAAALEKAGNEKKSVIASALGETLGGLISGGKVASVAAENPEKKAAILDGGGRGGRRHGKHLDLQDEGPGYLVVVHRRTSRIACVLEWVALLASAVAGLCLWYHVRWSADVDVHLSDERLKYVPIDAAMDWGRDNLGEAAEFGEESVSISASFFDKLGVCCVAAVATGALAGPPLRFLLLRARLGADHDFVGIRQKGERVEAARVRWYFVLLFFVLAMYPNLAAAAVMMFLHSVSQGSTEVANNILRTPFWSCVQPELLIPADYALYGGLVAALIVFCLFLQEMQVVEGEKPPDPESVVVTGLNDKHNKYLNGEYERMSGAFHQGHPVYTRDALMGDREVKLHLYAERLMSFPRCMPWKTELDWRIGLCPWKIPDYEVLLPPGFDQASAIDVKGFEASAESLNGRYEEMAMPRASKHVESVHFGSKIFRRSTKVPLVSYYVFPLGGFPRVHFEVYAQLVGETTQQQHELAFKSKLYGVQLLTGSSYVYVNTGTSHAAALGLVDGCPYIAEDRSRGEEKLLSLYHTDALLKGLEVRGEFTEGDRVVQVDTSSGELVAEGTVLRNLGQVAEGAMAMVRMNWGVFFFGGISKIDAKFGIGREVPTRRMTEKSTALTSVLTVILAGLRKEQSFDVGDVIRQGRTMAHVAKSCRGQEVEVVVRADNGDDIGAFDVLSNLKLAKNGAPDDVSIGPPGTVRGLVQLQGLQQRKYEVGTSVEQVNFCLDILWQSSSLIPKPQILKLAVGESVEQMTPQLPITSMILQAKEVDVEVTITLASEHGLQKGAKVSMGSFEQQTYYDTYFQLKKALDDEATIFNVTPSSFSIRLSKLLPSQLPAGSALPEQFWKDEKKKRTAWVRGCIARGSVLRSGTAHEPNTTSAIVHVTFGAFTMASGCKLQFGNAGNICSLSAVTEIHTVRLVGVTAEPKPAEPKPAEPKPTDAASVMNKALASATATMTGSNPTTPDFQIWEQSSKSIQVEKFSLTGADAPIAVKLPGHTAVKGSWIRLAGIGTAPAFGQKKSTSKLFSGMSAAIKSKWSPFSSENWSDLLNGLHRIIDVSGDTVFIENKSTPAMSEKLEPNLWTKAEAKEIMAGGLLWSNRREADLENDEAEIDVTHGEFSTSGPPLHAIIGGQTSQIQKMKGPKAIHRLSARGVVKNNVSGTNLMVSVTQGCFGTKGTVKVAGASVGAPSRVQPFPDTAPVVLGKADIVDGKGGSGQSAGNLVPMDADARAQKRWTQERRTRIATLGPLDMQPLSAKDLAYPLRYNRAGIITQTMLNGAADPVKSGSLDSSSFVARGPSLAGMGGAGGNWEVTEQIDAKTTEVVPSNTMRVHFKKRTFWRPHKDFVFDNLCSFFGVLTLKDGLLMLADVGLDFNTVYIYHSLGLYFFMSFGLFFIFYPPLCTWMLLNSIGLMGKADLFFCITQTSCLKEMYEELKLGKKTNNMVWVVLGEACLESAPQSILQTYCLLLNFKQLVSGGNELFISILLSLFNVAKNLATVDFYGIDGVSSFYTILRIFMRFLEVSSRVTTLAIFGCLLRPEGLGMHQNKQVALPSLIAVDAMLITLFIFVKVPRGGALNVFWGLAGVVAAPPIFNRTFRRFQLAYYFWRLLELLAMYGLCRLYSDFSRRVLHTEDPNMKFFMRVACFSTAAFYSLSLLAALEAGACKLFCPNRHAQRLGNPMGSIFYPIAPWAFDMWRWPWYCGSCYRCCRRTRKRIRWTDSKHAFSAVDVEEEYEDDELDGDARGDAPFLSAAGARNVAPIAAVVANRLTDKHARKVWHGLASGDLEATKVVEEDERDDDVVDNEGDEPLLDAVRQGDIMLCRVFSIGKMKPLTMVQSWNGHTPFHLAGLSGNRRMMEILLKCLEDQTTVVQHYGEVDWKRVTVEVGPHLFTPVDYMRIYQPDMANHLGFPEAGDLMGVGAVAVPDRRCSLDVDKREEKLVLEEIGERLMFSFPTETIKRIYGKDFVGIHDSCQLPVHIAASIGNLGVFDDIIALLSGDQDYQGLSGDVRDMRDVYGRTALDYVLNYAPFDASVTIDAAEKVAGGVNHHTTRRQRGSYQLLPLLMRMRIPFSGYTFRPSPDLIDESTLLEEIVDSLVLFPSSKAWSLDFSGFDRDDRDGQLVFDLGHVLQVRRFEKFEKGDKTAILPCEIVLCRTLATHIATASLASALGPPILTTRVDLDLTGTTIGDEGVLPLAKCLQNLSALRLSQCEITDVGAKYLGDALAGRAPVDSAESRSAASEFRSEADDGIAKVQLSVLDLRANYLSNRGAAFLLVALEPSGGAAAKQIRVIFNKRGSPGSNPLRNRSRQFIKPSKVLDHVPLLYKREMQRLESKGGTKTKGEELQFPPELMQHMDIFWGIDTGSTS